MKKKRILTETLTSKSTSPRPTKRHKTAASSQQDNDNDSVSKDVDALNREQEESAARLKLLMYKLEKKTADDAISSRPSQSSGNSSDDGKSRHQKQQPEIKAHKGSITTLPWSPSFTAGFVGGEKNLLLCQYVRNIIHYATDSLNSARPCQTMTLDMPVSSNEPVTLSRRVDHHLEWMSKWLRQYYAEYSMTGLKSKSTCHVSTGAMVVGGVPPPNPLLF